ncbi:MAG: TonB-dependent receptor [Chloracidobacterium sp.]|nr:TonB-dependent receptor [Chloracidobacterium sp.]
MRVITSKLAGTALRSAFIALALLAGVTSSFGQAQATAADLSGTVTDPNGAVVAGATITVRNLATGIARTVTSGSQGNYQLIGLPPGEYEVSAEASTFKKVVISGVRLTVGQSADLTIKLELGEATAVVNVSGEEVLLVETTRTSVANTIGQERIENLPINERSATGFALTLSTVGRDNGRPIGPAPTSGLNIGGQRGRSTQVNVDGADFTDNSINAARSTVSQEAVQEYQVSTNSYTAEFGRATGGVVNVVTKRGTNEFTGNVFGFIRDKSIQARNPFAPFKSAYTRTQYGATLGGPIVKDRTFFFAAFERRQRNESGFFTSDVAAGLTASASIPVIPGLNPIARTFDNLTPQQAGFINTLLASGVPANICAARAYAFFAASGSATALTGANPLISPNDGSACPAISPILPGVIGSRFLLTGAPVPTGTTNSEGQFIAFRPLNDLQQVFPVTDRSNYFSIRGDHNFNQDHQLTMRFGYNPGTLTGIQVESQNQSLGQNDFSRTGITEVSDYSISAALNSVLSGLTANELRFSYGRRDTTFKSQNGDAVAYNISGTAFIGRELFSPVDRTETRYQFADNFNWIAGSHTLKFGGDVNFVNIPDALFELNFAGLFNFGDFSAANLGFPASAPAFTPVQSYGLGLPSIYVQGFGNPISRIKNTPIAFFAQDSWRAARRLTINYGVRYDVELTETIAPVAFRDPLSGINLSEADILAAQDAVGVQQGIPRDTNNWAPRFGFAYDVTGNGRTVIRGALGIFYDHPLLAVAFNSDIADAAQQQQAVLTAGTPVPINTSTGAPTLLNAALVFHGTVCGAQGSNAALCGAFGNPVTPGVASSAQYQFGRQRFDDQTFSGFGPVLPFTLPIAKDFQYASATQGNLTVETRLTDDVAFSASYIYVSAHHLPHPTDLNTPNTALQIQNFQRFFGGALPTSTQAAIAFSIPTTAPGSPAGVGCAVVIPGMVAQCPTGRVVAPAIANFFRPNAPNYFLASALSGGAVSKAVLDSQLAGSLRTPGVISPFGSVNAQISDGNSKYNALNFELKRRFANNFQFLASYTLSQSQDDSSDLQTLLIAQDVNDFRAEWADSLFDQRHRFVLSGVIASPASWRSADSGWKRFMADFSLAPIIEFSSGRPFNIITNVDANNDQSTQTDRPSVNPDGSLCVPGESGCVTPLITDGEFSVGNLSRNRGLTRGYASVDLRLTRAFRFGERFRLDLIAEGFNLLNRFNEASASPNYRDVNALGQRTESFRYFSKSTAAYDPRQFQFGFKLNF